MHTNNCRKTSLVIQCCMAYTLLPCTQFPHPRTLPSMPRTGHRPLTATHAMGRSQILCTAAAWPPNPVHCSPSHRQASICTLQPLPQAGRPESPQIPAAKGSCKGHCHYVPQASGSLQGSLALRAHSYKTI